MTTYKEKIVDAVTGEETFKDYTPAQLEEVEAAKIEGEKRREVEAKAEADKASILAKLGITADEAKLLLS